MSRFVTTNSSDGSSKFVAESVLSTTPPWFAAPGLDSISGYIGWTTRSSPATLAPLTAARDVSEYTAEDRSGVKIVTVGGSNAKMFDFGPKAHIPMHRTASVDYCVVVEGELEASLDSGETRLLGKGDVIVQRGTMHAWRNPSETAWCRVFFVSLEAEKVKVGGEDVEWMP